MSNYIIRDDELYHWKYIKRVKVNGKWRYYYSKYQLKKDLGIYAKNKYEQAKRNEKLAEGRRNVARNELDYHRSNLNPNEKIEVIRTGKQVQYQKSVDNYIKSADAYVAAKKKTESYLEEYKSTPLGKLHTAVEKGKQIVNSIFNKKKKK